MGCPCKKRALMKLRICSRGWSSSESLLSFLSGLCGIWPCEFLILGCEWTFVAVFPTWSGAGRLLSGSCFWGYVMGSRWNWVRGNIMWGSIFVLFGIPPCAFWVLWVSCLRGNFLFFKVPRVPILWNFTERHLYFFLVVSTHLLRNFGGSQFLRIRSELSSSPFLLSLSVSSLFLWSLSGRLVNTKFQFQAHRIDPPDNAFVSTLRV